IRPHEHTPLTLVKAASQVPSSQPLFESLVVFENQRLDQAMRSLGGHWASRQVDLHELTNFPVTVAAYGGDELSFKIVFNRFRLDESTVRRMLGHFRRLLEGFAANPQTAVCDLPLITGAEQQRLLVDWNSTEVIYPESPGRIHELIEAQVSRTPNHIAIVVEQQKVTYRALNQRANQLAQHLRILGVGPDVLVGLCVERSVEMVVGLLGILKAGGAYVPLDPSFPDERLTYMVEDSGIRVLVTHRDYHEKL